LEETYFRKREQELLEKLHREKALELEREHMAESSGIGDPSMLLELQKDGYTEETIALLPLVPMIAMAWAEGGVADREREKIFEIARSRNILPGSPSYRQLSEWLETKPAHQFFEDTLHALGMMLRGLAPDARRALQENILAYCRQVAATASGVILGRGKLSAEEEDLISHIAREVGYSGK
jgi:hypothetical protein